MAFQSLIERIFTKIRLGGSATGPLYSSGAGSPEGVVTAPVGSVYSRTDGGANTTLYRKESGVGNTGWVAVSNAAGGGGGSANGVIVNADFGVSFSQKAEVVVTGQTWVDSSKPLVGNVLAPAGTDADELFLLDFRIVFSNVVTGVGFTVTIYSETEARGSYPVMIVGQ